MSSKCLQAVHCSDKGKMLLRIDWRLLSMLWCQQARYRREASSRAEAKIFVVWFKMYQNCKFTLNEMIARNLTILIIDFSIHVVISAHLTVILDLAQGLLTARRKWSWRANAKLERLSFNATRFELKIWQLLLVTLSATKRRNWSKKRKGLSCKRNLSWKPRRIASSWKITRRSSLRRNFERSKKSLKRKTTTSI